MGKHPDFWSVLLGTAPPGFIFGYIVMGYLAAITMIMIHASSRDPDSPATPKKWSWKFFWVNNSIRFLVGAFLIPIFIRVAIEYMEGIWMLLLSIGIGFGFMYLAQIAKKWGFMTTAKLSEKITEMVEKKRIEKELSDKQ